MASELIEAVLCSLSWESQVLETQRGSSCNLAFQAKMMRKTCVKGEFDVLEKKKTEINKTDEKNHRNQTCSI